MKHPPYHLRTNKAVDRFMLVEAIRCLGGPNELSRYTYYGFGGPYLEEFRLLYEYFPEMKMVSIEEDSHTYEQQKFHLPCCKVKLELAKFKSFLAQYSFEDNKSIFWLDYTKLNCGEIDEFVDLLSKVADDSIVKITLRAEPKEYLDLDGSQAKENEFRDQFGLYLPSCDRIPRDFESFAILLQDILRIASQKALPSANGRVFQPISSFFYMDGSGMFTLMGVVCLKNKQNRFIKLFKKLHFCNFTWGKPTLIDLPFLSTKERLTLQKHLPCKKNAGGKLYDVLGYSIDRSVPKAKIKLDQYSKFYRYYPHFVKAIP
jgi:hypothetical protein